MVMVSTPAPMATSAPSCTIWCAAIMMACEPEEQKRFTVVAATSLGKPAAMAAMRAVFMPWQPSGMPQPAITSSISLASRPLVRATTSLKVWAR
jgi:hypothetical protein